MKRTAGFTLLELLISSTLILALGALGFATCTKLRVRAQMTTEIHAARNLATAFLSHASDHSGQLLAGYQSDPEARNFDGELLHHPVNARYPWRLAPYIGQVDGVLFFNGNEAVLDRHDDYLVSVSPNLGMNAVFVGGHFGSGSPLRPTPRVLESVGRFYASRLAEVDHPEKLVVFASARSSEGWQGRGYYEVRPPKILGPVWSDDLFDPEQASTTHGFVDFRWPGARAVVAKLAGNVEVLDEQELRDMRHWSHLAAKTNNPDYVVRPLH